MVDGSRPQIKSDGNRNPMIGDTLIYNLISEKGIIKQGKTELNDAFYHGEDIISDNKEIIYSYDGMYTSCNLDP